MPGGRERPRRRARGDGGGDRAVLHGGAGARRLAESGRNVADPPVRGRHGGAPRALPLPEAQGRGLFSAMPAGGVRRAIGGAARSRGRGVQESGRHHPGNGHGGGGPVSARRARSGEGLAADGGSQPGVRRRGASVRGGDRPSLPRRRGIAEGRRVENDLRAFRAARGVAGIETGDAGGEARRGESAADPFGGRQNGAAGPGGAGQGGGAGGGRHRLRGAVAPVLPRPARAGE